MGAFEEFRDKIHTALVHLYDPNYQPDAQLYQALGCDPAAGPGALQAALLRLIEHLAEQATEQGDSRVRRSLDVLHRRFVLGLTQEETAEMLYLSLRSVQRAQQEGVHALACWIWRNQPTEAPAGDPARDWLAQVRQEVLSLQKSSADAECDLARTVQETWQLVEVIAARRDITVQVLSLQPDLRVRLHYSALRQAFLTTISALTEAIPAGGILTVNAGRYENNPTLTIQAEPVLTGRPIDISLAQELIAMLGGHVELSVQENQAVLTATLPSAARLQERCIVLVVDDNADLVTLYQSYCAGTRYELLHVKEGRRVFEVATAVQPAAILLDVILPDVDGWDLLMELRANPATRAIPVIVCSVVTDEQLALALGAVRYLRKPVWREQLLEALANVIR